LALAESGKADYFCTCDDKLLRTAKQVRDLKLVFRQTELS
jgi:predicted nucleic acid-binding protein